MGFMDFLHSVADTMLGWVKMAQNRQVGWQTVNREDGKFVREQEPLMKKLKMLFLFNPLTEWIDTTHAMRLYMHNKSIEEGKEYSKEASRNQIKGFVDFYNINMDDFEPSDVEKYRTFEDFFIRKHKEGSRPIYAQGDNSKAVVVADCRCVVYDTVAESHKLWIKGSDFSITNLVMDTQLGKQFADGPTASFRLSPQDYHRYHSPVTGKIKLFRSMPGDYYEVDPVAITSKVDIVTRNARDYVVIETKEFGDVLFVAIGATEVGTVYFYEKSRTPGSEIKKGEELGIFQFGGSAIIVTFESGRIRFDEDLLGLSKRRIMMDVKVGMSLGQAVKK